MILDFSKARARGHRISRVDADSLAAGVARTGQGWTEGSAAVKTSPMVARTAPVALDDAPASAKIDQASAHAAGAPR